MYTPQKFKITDPVEISRFIEQHPFGLIITVDDGMIHDTHTPFILSDQDGHLYGHIAKANPQWQHWVNTSNSNLTTAKVIFTGAHSYISPHYYSSEFNVPTWNYTAVSVTGKISIVDNDEEALEFLDLLVRANEPSKDPWVLDRNNEDYMKLIAGIIVFKVSLEKVEASFKLNQNKSQEDQRNVVSALEKSACPYDHAVAERMKKNLES